MKKHLPLTLFAVLFAQLIVFAQSKSTLITGKIIDQGSGAPIEFATVMISDQSTGTAITGTTTDLDGVFEVSTTATDYYVEIRFIGYETQRIDDITVVKGKADLGEITLGADSETLDEIVVRAEKSSTEFKLDKRVFNVGQDLSSTGAGALEVLNNVPSVNVNIEGKVSLRGSSGVQILINGKPSVIASEQGNALGTITADMIEKIEVITNPSAKYEAEGTSGIINIVLKKDERQGINGSVTLNVGAPHNHSIGLSLNQRTEKFNLFSQLGVGYRELPTDSRTSNVNLTDATRLDSDGEEFRNEQFYNLILGTDYYINENNIITLSGSFAYEIEDQPSETAFTFQRAGGITDQWVRTEETSATNPKYQYELQYKSTFEDDEDHSLLISAIGNLFTKDQSSEFFDRTISGSDRDNDQITRTDFGETRHTFKLDYTKPLAEKYTLEVGSQYVLNDVANDYGVSNLVNGSYVEDPNLTNDFEYQQNVLGVYTTAAYEDDVWGVKAGLRMEHTDLSTLLVNTDEGNNQTFSNFFPTLHTSYKISPALSLQAGYSKRIFRPRLWDLNPFFNIRNNFSIRTGNPDLLPEYTSSYEITSIYIVGQVSMNLGVYYRYTTDVIERISTFSEGVSTVRPFNIGTNKATGIEYNFKYSPSNKWSMNGDVNFNFFNREGVFEGNDIGFDNNVWTAKYTNKIKLPANFEAEATIQYQSATETIQGETEDILFTDLGVRKKIMNGKGVFSLSVRDLFASRINESYTFQPAFQLYSFRQRGRFVTLGFSYGFGKGEAMEFGAAKRL